MQTLQRCEHCGFEIGDDAHRCRAEPTLTPEAQRAVRQVVGEALPTRSTHALPHARSRRERRPTRSDRRPSWASDLVAYATLLGVAALIVLGLDRLAATDRFSLKVPDGLPTWLDRIWVVLLAAAIVTAVLAGLAWSAQGLRHQRQRRRERLDRARVVPTAR